jgi:integrase
VEAADDFLHSPPVNALQTALIEGSVDVRHKGGFDSIVERRQFGKSELPRIRFHDLRHTHVAHLIAAGEQPLLIAKRLGHASSAFTMDRYGHPFETAGSQAASAVAAMVDGATTA